MASIRRTRVAGVALMASAALLAALPAAAGDVVKIQRSIPIAASVDMSTAVRTECELDTKVSKFVKEFAGDKVEIVEGALDREKGRALEMEITEVWAPGGGGYLGPKWMTVKGQLYENGKAADSFRAKRFSTGGMFAGFKGTCSIIGRCTKAIGEDIAHWLEAPTANAKLGDAR